MTRRASLAALAWLFVLLVVAWLAWGQLVAPSVIARAYRGDGLALLQRLLQAHGPRPLADYLEFWRRSVWTLAVLWIGGGFGWWAITRPGFQRWWDATGGVPPDVRPAADLGRRRLAGVQTFIVLLLAAQGAAIVSWLELWPFSPYKMFSETRRSSDALTRYRVFGIPTSYVSAGACSTRAPTPISPASAGTSISTASPRPSCRRPRGRRSSPSPSSGRCRRPR